MRRKINVKDVTFLIPIRIDSIMRMENLIMATDFINSNFDTNILILEASNYNNGLIKKLLASNIKVIWKADYDPIFHRTFYINEMVKQCKTTYVAIWDADVIVPSKQVERALELLRNGKSDFVIPFDKFLDTSYIIREMFLMSKDLKVLQKNERKMVSLYENPKPVGGAFIINRKLYVESGMENEKFYGWGIEDGERINRLLTLGVRHSHVQGKLYHLTHVRDLNSKFQSEIEHELKEREFSRIVAMSTEELQKEIQLWNKE